MFNFTPPCSPCHKIQNPNASLFIGISFVFVEAKKKRANPCLLLLGIQEADFSPPSSSSSSSYLILSLHQILVPPTAATEIPLPAPLFTPLLPRLPRFAFFPVPHLAFASLGAGVGYCGGLWLMGIS